MAEEIINELVGVLVERTKKLIQLTQDLINEKIGNLKVTNKYAMNIGTQAALRWKDWDPSQSEDIFEMNKECVDILCDFHYFVRLQKYENEERFCISGDVSFLAEIKECNTLLGVIDLLIEELGLTN